MPEFSASIILNDLDGSDGFRIDGVRPYGFTGWSASSAGDINNDGYDDLIFGSPSGFGSDSFQPRGSSAHVLFGSEEPVDAVFDISVLDGSNGFNIGEFARYDRGGDSVAAAGDVNGDGIDDLIVGAPLANPSGSVDAGRAYVIFGKETEFPETFGVKSLDGTNGFVLKGDIEGESVGDVVSSAGDFNGDGFDDLLIGAPTNGYSESPRASYIVFGKADDFKATQSVGSLDGTDGFQIDGNRNGSRLSDIGDINDDGFDDVIVGSLFSIILEQTPTSISRTSVSTSHVLLGQAGPFDANIDLNALNETQGFELPGLSEFDSVGRSVSGIGDFNADGIDDFIVGATASFRASSLDRAYVIFGTSNGYGSKFDFEALDGTNGFEVGGIQGRGIGGIVSDAGDVNGDGYDDFLIGSSNFGFNEVYVVFGGTDGFNDFFDLKTLDGSNGFVIENNLDPTSRVAGRAVSSAGDLNGDGFADIVIGATHTDTPTVENAGSVFVVYGHRALEAVTRIGTEIDNIINGGYGADTIIGDAGDDILLGWESADRIFGGAGNDRSNGGSGDDTIVGGDGDDKVRGGTGADTLQGNDGIDWLQYVSSKQGVTIDLNTDAETGLQSASGGDAEGDIIRNFERVLASDHADTLIGDNGDNYLIGRTGDDMTSGGDGNDKIRGNEGADTLDGGAGLFDVVQYIGSAEGVSVDLNADAVTGLQSASGGDAEGDVISGFEQIYGSNHADILTGDEQDNIILGRDGDDTIRGSAGRDNLEGGADADRFIFAEGAELDKIRDFEQGLDIIEFLDLEFADLSITSGGRQALIEYGASDAITIRSMDGNPFTLTVDDFAFS